MEHNCRSPCGERGLKFDEKISGERSARSLPVRGAWIEMDYPTDKASINSRRSPCGERGLKCYHFYTRKAAAKSLPVRGAWIEIAINGTSDYPTESLPVRGAWIEI
mgnify:CR=1 FL=1